MGISDLSFITRRKNDSSSNDLNRATTCRDYWA
jgi:hypothetical protein